MTFTQPSPLLAFVTIAGFTLTGWSQQLSQVRQPITFLELNDVHITLADESNKYPSKIIEAMNREGAAFTLVCGDLATDGNRGELEMAKAVLDRLDRPYYPVAGNHDAQFSGTREETVFREVFGLKGNSYYFVRDGIHFIALDPGAGSDYQNNAVRPDVMEWLSGVVAAIPVVVQFESACYG